MYIQAEVLQWLKTLDINRIKHLLTLKNSSNISYIKRILMTKPECKPIDRISHGYSDNKFNMQKSISHIYIRESYRYKTRKQEKKAMDKILFENITVSRLNPWAFSLKKAFIKSKDFARCMLLFSDEQIFNYTDMKQTPVKLGNEKQLVSLWFNSSNVKSFSEWLVHLFEMQIFEAYQLQRSSKISLIPQLSYFSYVAENITKQQIKGYIENSLYVLSEKRFNGKFAKKSGKKQIFFSKQQEEDEQVSVIQVSVQEVPYLLTRCLQKFQDANRNIDEIVFQYEWYSEERKSKVNRIIKDICRVISRKFKEFQLDAKAKQIEALGQTGKKKKKRGTKKHNANNEDESQLNQQKTEQKKQMKQRDSQTVLTTPKKQQNIIAKQQTPKKESIVPSEISKKQIISNKPQDCHSESVGIKKEETRQSLQFTPVKSNKIQQKPQEKMQNLQQLKTKQKKPQKQAQKAKGSPKQKESFAKLEANGLHQKEDKKLKQKIVNERINEHILSYYNHICESSQAIDKYRKICIELIEKTIEQMGLKAKWELILFGSYSVDFALRESDLDLVVVAQGDQSFSLHRLYQHFKVKEWLRECNIIQIQSAKVPILQFEIILSCLKHPKLKDAKKVSNDVIHVDITMAFKRQTHEGIRNTNIMNNIFGLTPNLRNIGLIFKQLLRIYDLNKPFKGGIGSYVLIILLHNILNIQAVEINSDYVCQMMIICEYMSEKFQPYKTLISPFKKTVLVANPKLELNLQDPEDHVLINTTKMRQINEIILLFKQFQHLLLEIEQSLMSVNIEERKKMKRIFFEKWNVLFKPHENLVEHQK